MMFVIAQIFGLFAIFSIFIAFQRKNRNGILVFKLSGDIFWVLHYLFLGGIAGMIPNFIAVFRELVFMKRGTCKWADNLLLPIGFVALTWLLGLVGFKTAFDILPVAASGLMTGALWCKKIKIIKATTVFVAMLFFIYDISIGAYMGILSDTFTIISIIISFIRGCCIKD